MIKSGLAFHCHHNKLFEYVYDYNERVAFIKDNKPKKEQELRLRLFQIIPDELIPGRDSQEYVAYAKPWVASAKAWVASAKARVASDKARVAYAKARVAYAKARVASDKAWVASDKAWVAYDKKYRLEIEKLHQELCPDCPWDGHTIFKGAKK